MALTRPRKSTTQHDQRNAEQNRQKDELRALLLGKIGQGHLVLHFLERLGLVSGKYRMRAPVLTDGRLSYPIR
jgi:hypothetical protein